MADIPPTSDTVRANAYYHTELLRQIAELDYVPQALQQQSLFVSDLEKQLDQGKRQLKELEQKTQKEKKEHEAIRNSVAKRFAHKLTGRREKFESKASKEEREYVEALERELTERDSLQISEQLLTAAKVEQSKLKGKKEIYDNFKNQLDGLYHEIFDGPSADYPEDDRLEYYLHEVEKQHDDIQKRLNQESQAAELLARALQALTNCQSHISKALSCSTWDMWGGGSFSDMMEREALRSASSSAYSAQNIVEQARHIQPYIQPLPTIDMAQGSIISDVFFDNVFTDMAFHHKIQASANEVRMAINFLKDQQSQCQTRIDSVGGQLVNISKDLDARRQALTAFRSAIFESMATTLEPLPAGRPPAYEQAQTAPAAPMAVGPMSAPSFPTAQVQSLEPTPNGSNPYAPPPGPPPQWGSRNPFAAAMAQRS